MKTKEHRIGIRCEGNTIIKLTPREIFEAERELEIMKTIVPGLDYWSFMNYALEEKLNGHTAIGYSPLHPDYKAWNELYELRETL